MIFWLMPLIVSLFWMGVTAISKEQSGSVLPASIQSFSTAAGQAFLAYRNAVGSYAMTNPAFTGTVPASSLSPWLASGMPLPAGAGNQVDATPSGHGRILYAWAQSLPAAAANAASAAGGDASVGTVSGTQWISPIYGVQTLVVPALVPNGDVLSVVQLGY